MGDVKEGQLGLGQGQEKGVITPTLEVTGENVQSGNDNNPESVSSVSKQIQSDTYNQHDNDSREEEINNGSNTNNINPAITDTDLKNNIESITQIVDDNGKKKTCVTMKGGRGGKRKSKKSSKKTSKSSTRKTKKGSKKSNKKVKKTQKGGSSLAHSDFNTSQSIATSVDKTTSLAGSIESGLFPSVQKITGGMNMGGMNMGGGSGCSTKMLGGKKKKTSKK